MHQKTLVSRFRKGVTTNEQRTLLVKLVTCLIFERTQLLLENCENCQQKTQTGRRLEDANSV